MKKRTYLKTIIFCFFLILGSKSTLASNELNINNDIKEVLVLNSYHLTYEWTFNQNVSLNETLSKTYPNAVIYTEFLDWKRFSDPELLNTYMAYLQEKYNNMTIDLIMTTDDKALEFAIEHRKDFLNNAPIVFSGIIEGTAEEIIGDADRITGVYEKMDPTGALDLISTLQPDVNHIFVLHDDSESGLRTVDLFYKAVEAYNNRTYITEDLSDLSYSAIIDKLKTLPSQSVVMLISYSKSADRGVEKPQFFSETFSEVSSVPIYSIDEHLLGYGITGGTFLSGNLQGEQLATLGIKVLNGESPNALHYIDKATVYTAVDERYLTKYELNKALVPYNTIIINENITFLDRYKNLVLLVGLIIFFLVNFIFVLLFNIRKRHISEQKVSEQKLELQILYEQLMASEEELRAQNEDLQSYQVQLKHDAYHDYLTNLPNRLYLKERLNGLIANATNNPITFALITIGLDNFKFINNTYGHRYGDLLLVNFSERLKSLQMANFQSRLSGDEFTLILPIEQSDRDAYIYKVLSIIKNTLMNSFIIEEDEIQLTSSIGYSIFPDDGLTFEDLLVQADLAMYQAKKHGKSTFRHYNSEMSTYIENDYLLIAHLKTAYELKELTLHFQPQINALTNTIVGFEALLRWHNPQFGNVPPLKIIPLAEASGLIIPIGQCIIEQSLIFAIDMLDYMDDHFTVSINISVIQLLEQSFVPELIEMIESYEVSPSYIRLEITESILIESYDLILGKLNQLRNYGFSISLDDFGTGYSSLSYLQKLPLNELKIDKQFIDEILTVDDDHFLLDTIIGLAQKLNLTLVAEGVEHKHQADYLLSKGCHIMQGFYYSKPIPVNDVILYCRQLKQGTNLL